MPTVTAMFWSWTESCIRDILPQFKGVDGFLNRVNWFSKFPSYTSESMQIESTKMNLLFTNKNNNFKKYYWCLNLVLQHYFYLDVDSYVDMTSVRNNPVSTLHQLIKTRGATNPELDRRQCFCAHDWYSKKCRLYWR